MSLLLSFLETKEDFCEGACSSGPVFGPELQRSVLRLGCFAGAPSCLKRAILELLLRRVQYAFLGGEKSPPFCFFLRAFDLRPWGRLLFRGVSCHAVSVGC